MSSVIDLDAAPSSSSAPNSMPPQRRVRRRLTQLGHDAVEDEAIQVALAAADNDVDEAIDILVEQQPQPAGNARGKQPQSLGNAQRKRKVRQEEPAAEAAPAMLAARVCESLREAGLPRGSVANYDLAVAFLARHAAELGRSKKRETAIRVVYHGTNQANFRKIMEGNLQVPNGTTVRHANDSGYYGRGIYASPQFSYAQNYASNGPVFVCLSLPGKMKAVGRRDGQPCTPGYDSHSGEKGQEHVFFSSDQLLPCYIVDKSNLNAANAAVAKAIELILRTTGSSNSCDVLQRQGKFQVDPVSGGVAGGAGGPGCVVC